MGTIRHGWEPTRHGWELLDKKLQNVKKIQKWSLEDEIQLIHGLKT